MDGREYFCLFEAGGNPKTISTASLEHGAKRSFMPNTLNKR